MGTATDVGSGVEVVNTFLSEMVTHFEQEGVPVQQGLPYTTDTTIPLWHPFLTVLNPDVTNTDRSIHYIAVILDKYSGVGKFGISTDRCKIEKAVKDSACGNCREARYFLKDTSVNATTIQGQPKDSLNAALLKRRSSKQIFS